MQSVAHSENRASARQAIDLDSVKLAYRRYARIYDLLFGPVLEQGRHAAVEKINTLSGRRILEVGVGTGLSLPTYRSDARVVGIDLCSEMLEKARRRVQRLGLKQVEALLEMDGEDMTFPDHGFDAVVAMYVVGVTPNPARLMSEMRRVCTPGGDIIVLNHFASNHPVLRLLERVLAPLSATLGFRSNLEFATLAEATGLDLIQVRDTNLFGYSKLICFRAPVA